jgi:hypothetical protein
VPLDIRSLVGEPTPPWIVIAERKIQEWIEGGGPSRLSNKGQPLDLTENPFVPSELRMAYRVMKNADVVPDWIEIGREVETHLGQCREAVRRFQHAQRKDRLGLRTATAAEAEAIEGRLALRRQHFVAEHRARLGHANFLIGRFNTACPVSGLHRMRLDVERELAAAVG